MCMKWLLIIRLVNSVNHVNSVHPVNSVNSDNSVNSVNSYSAVLPASPMVFFSNVSYAIFLMSHFFPLTNFFSYVTCKIFPTFHVLLIDKLFLKYDLWCAIFLTFYFFPFTNFFSPRCDLNAGERNYNVCFYMFSFMMVRNELIKW